MLVLLNIVPFVGWGVVMIFLLWPWLGSWALAVSAPLFVYPVYAWFEADKIVARQAEFRPPTSLQEKYFNFLGLTETVWTHPSLIVAAGVLAGPRGKTFLVTAGLTRYLHDEEIKLVIERLGQRNERPLANWTYHMATGAAMVFVLAPKHDFSSQWARLILITGTVFGALTLSMIVVFMSALHGTVPLWLAVAALLIPLVVLIMWMGWSFGVMTMSRWTAQNWNQAVHVSDVRLQPMSRPVDAYHRIHLVSAGMIESLDVPEFRDPPELAAEESPAT